MSKKVICTVTNDLITDQRMQRIAASLGKNGFEVMLVGRKLDDSNYSTNGPYKVHRIKCRFNKGFLFYAEYNVRLFFFLLVHKFDVVNAVDLDTAIAGILASTLKRKKVTLDAHEDYVESPEITNRSFVKKFWSVIESFAFNNVDEAYTVSHQIAEKFSTKFNREVQVIRNMPNYNELDQQPTLKTEQAKPIVIYQGALNIGRGIVELIEAIAPLNMELWIAGDGDLKEDILQLISTKNLEEKITYLGRLTPSELHQKTAQADIGVNLLEHLGESYYHSLSNKFFDYVMAEIPQLCIDFPEYRRFNEEFGVAVLIDDINPLTIRENLQNLSVNSALIEQLITNCRSAKKRWNWEHEEKRLIEIYQTL